MATVRKALRACQWAVVAWAAAALPVTELGVASLTTAGLGIAGCVQPDASSGDGIRVGLLLPFTGEQGAAGLNLERAVLMAAEAFNVAGGAAGHNLRVIARDTGSDDTHGLSGLQDLVESKDVVAVLGPESDSLAEEAVPIIRQHGVVQISGGVTAPHFTSIDDDGYWFRTVPSALLLGKALAKRIYDDGVRSIAMASCSKTQPT